MQKVFWLVWGAVFFLGSLAEAATPGGLWFAFLPFMTLSKTPIAANVCERTLPCSNVYLKLEVANGMLSRATFYDSPGTAEFVTGTALTQADLAKVKLTKDASGNFWLKQLPMPARYVHQMAVLGCWAEPTLGNPITQLSNANILFVFDTETVGEFKPYATSQCAEFTGHFKDKTAFYVHVSLQQSRYVQ